VEGEEKKGFKGTRDIILLNIVVMPNCTVKDEKYDEFYLGTIKHKIHKYIIYGLVTIIYPKVTVEKKENKRKQNIILLNNVEVTCLYGKY
jgi:hypothetical protein